jgi:hypothetical protein
MTAFEGRWFPTEPSWPRHGRPRDRYLRRGLTNIGDGRQAQSGRKPGNMGLGLAEGVLLQANSLLGVQVSDRNLAGKSKIKANNQKTGETGRFPPVGFASESGHVHCTRRCPLWANIRHCRLPHRSMRWAAIASSFHSKPSPGTSGTCSMPFLISYGLCRTGSAQSCHSSQCADSVTRMT